MRTDFYLLSSNSSAERDQIACKLIEKAFLAQQTVYVATNTDDQAAEFDKLLWEFRAESFIPHALCKTLSENSLAPVLIGIPNATQPSEIWLNLSDQLPPSSLSCQRLIEIIPNNPDLQTKARERFRQYRDQGHAINSHKI
jgi:DNA polymerase-3 subunit chi